MSTLSITKERVLAAAKTCPKAQQLLESLFPDAFEDNKVFCRINDVLIRKGTNCFYQVVEKGNQVALVNLTHNHDWENRIPQPYEKYCGDYNKTLSRADMKTLLTGQVKNLNDFKVLSISELQKQFD